MLKENRRGSISGIVKPETGQANFDEKTIRLGAPLFIRLVGVFDDRDAIGEFKRGLETFRQPRLNVGPHGDPVDDDVDVVLELFVEDRRVGDFIKLRRRFSGAESRAS